MVCDLELNKASLASLSLPQLDHSPPQPTTLNQHTINEGWRVITVNLDGASHRFYGVNQHCEKKLDNNTTSKTQSINSFLTKILYDESIKKRQEHSRKELSTHTGVQTKKKFFPNRPTLLHSITLQSPVECISCGKHQTFPKQKQQQQQPSCHDCVKHGTIERINDNKLQNLFKKMRLFFKEDLDFDITKFDFLNMKQSDNLSICHKVPLQIIHYSMMNDDKLKLLRKLGHCECRVATDLQTNLELKRWINQILVSNGLTVESFGGILMHEMIHAYRWLLRIKFKTFEEEEVICNLIASQFLHKELQNLLSLKTKTEYHLKQIQVLNYRLLKMTEFNKRSNRLIEVTQHYIHLLKNNTWKQLFEYDQTKQH